MLAAVTACAGAPAGDGRAGAAKVFRVCLVTGAAGLYGPAAAAAAAGLASAGRTPGVVTRSIETSSSPAFAAGLRSCVVDGADLTIAAGFPSENAVDAVATAYPDASFAAIGVDVATLVHRPRNVQGVLFAGEQAGYLAGYAAGRWARSAHGRAVGSVGGLEIPPIERVVAGFEHGAAEAAPGIRTIHAWATGLDDSASCRRRALAELDAGAAVELAPGGPCGEGVAAAAAAKHAASVAIGAADVAPPSRALLEVRLRVDVAVESAVAAARAGRLRPGRDVLVGAAEGAITVGPWGPRAPGWLRSAVDRQFALLRAGRIHGIPVAVS